MDNATFKRWLDMEAQEALIGKGRMWPQGLPISAATATSKYPQDRR